MKNSKLFGGILLIAGTTIGAAMLALPVSTGLIGFFPAVFIFIFCWLTMLWSAYLILEVNLSLPGQVNLISMAKTTLGQWGSIVEWVGILALLYSVSAAYMTGSGPIFMEGIRNWTGYDLPNWFTPFPILILFGPCVYFGVKFADYINRYLMFGLVFSYALMVVLLLNHLTPHLLFEINFNYFFFAFPVVFTSFGYHTIIPSLVTYLDRDVTQIKKCIFWGSFLPIVVYLLWELLILGTIPISGTFGLVSMLKNDIAPALALEHVLGNHLIATITIIFTLFAIITSFIGVSQSLFDFLKDGIKANDTFLSRLGVLSLTFLPPLFFVIIFQKGFVAVLEYAGIIIAVILGIMPILMVWSSRYIKKTNSAFRASGGKFLFIIGIIFYLFVIAILLASQAGYIAINYNEYL